MGKKQLTDKEIFNSWIERNRRRKEKKHLGVEEITIDFAKYYHKQRLAIHSVVVPNGTLVCECGEKPKDVPNDGYEYICNKCRKPFAN